MAPSTARPTGDRRAADRGAAAVEFAIVLPVLLLIIFGIIDFGRMINAQLRTTQAAREAARADSLGASTQAVRERVGWAMGAQGLATIDLSDSEFCPDALDPDDAGDHDSRITVIYEFTFVTPLGVLIGFGNAGGTALEGKGVMPCRA